MDTSPTETYPICHTLSLHSALPIYLTSPTEEPALHRALHTGPGEIFTLRDEGDASAHHENQEERVDDCPMVAGENHRPFLGDVVLTLDRRPPEQPEDRADQDVFEQPIEHRASPFPSSRQCLRRE